MHLELVLTLILYLGSFTATNSEKLRSPLDLNSLFGGEGVNSPINQSSLLNGENSGVNSPLNLSSLLGGGSGSVQSPLSLSSLLGDGSGSVQSPLSLSSLLGGGSVPSPLNLPSLLGSGSASTKSPTTHITYPHTGTHTGTYPTAHTRTLPTIQTPSGISNISSFNIHQVSGIEGMISPLNLSSLLDSGNGGIKSPLNLSSLMGGGSSRVNSPLKLPSLFGGGSGNMKSPLNLSRLLSDGSGGMKSPLNLNSLQSVAFSKLGNLLINLTKLTTTNLPVVSTASTPPSGVGSLSSLNLFACPILGGINSVPVLGPLFFNSVNPPFFQCTFPNNMSDIPNISASSSGVGSLTSLDFLACPILGGINSIPVLGPLFVNSVNPPLFQCTIPTVN